jgi:ankyrin repeat protein
VITRKGRGAALALVALALLTGASAPPPELVDAARRGDLAAVRALLRNGTDPNVAQGDGLTALHAAAQGGNLDIVRVLIEAKANVEARSRLGGYTPLHLAAQGGHLTVVRALLDGGATTGVATTTTGVTPLHLAAQAVNAEAVLRLLVERGAPIEATERQADQTPLMFAAAAGRVSNVQELLRLGANPNAASEVVDVLQRVAIDRAASEYLRNQVADIRRNSPEGTDRPLTLAEQREAVERQRAYVSSQEEMNKLLADFSPANLVEAEALWDTPTGQKSEVLVPMRPQRPTFVQKTGGMSALLFAAREGNIEVARALLDGGADIDQVSGDGTSPLLLALMNGQFDLGMMLIERGADVNRAADSDGIAPLFAVLQTQWAGYNSEQPQPRAQELQTAQYMDVFNALLAKGADPNARLTQHLYYLVWAGQLGLDITGATPFWRAAYAQDLEAMKALVAHGADPFIPTRWPEIGMRTARQQDGRIMDDSGIPRAEGAANMYPLHAAAGGGYMGLASWTVQSVPNNFLPTVKYLVEDLGYDVNLRDSWGYTPLHYAAVRGGNDLIEYLVSKGADVSATSLLGQSPVDMARGGRAGYFERVPFPETVDLLTKLGSPLKCLSTSFRGTGDLCAEFQGVPFKGLTLDENQPPPTL